MKFVSLLINTHKIEIITKIIFFLIFKLPKIEVNAFNFFLILYNLSHWFFNWQKFPRDLPWWTLQCVNFPIWLYSIFFSNKCLVQNRYEHITFYWIFQKFMWPKKNLTLLKLSTYFSWFFRYINRLKYIYTNTIIFFKKSYLLLWFF